MRDNHRDNHRDNELEAALKRALASDSAPVAYQKAMAALTERERIAANLWRDGAVTSQRRALAAAGYTKKTSQRPESIFGRVKVRLALLLGEKAENQIREITAETFLADLVELASANPVDMIGSDGRVLPPREWPKNLQRMVKKIEFNALGGVESVIFEGRAQIQAMVGKHRLVKAFDAKTVERRVYVFRDYTGRTDKHGKPLPIADTPGSSQILAGERIEDAEKIDSARLVEGPQSGSADPQPWRGGADEQPGRSSTDTHGIADIDKGFVPISR